MYFPAAEIMYPNTKCQETQILSKTVNVCRPTGALVSCKGHCRVQLPLIGVDNCIFFSPSFAVPMAKLRYADG